MRRQRCWPSGTVVTGSASRCCRQEYEVPAACRAAIELSFATPGMARRGGDGGRGELAGFMIATPQLFPPTHFLASFFPPRSIGISYQSHATRGGEEYDVYRAMYAELADYFVNRGYFDHIDERGGAGRGNMRDVGSLGFGRHSVAAMRGVEPTERVPAGVEVHQASTEDASVVYALAEELNEHHARAPIYWPYIREADAASHELSLGLLSDPNNAHWVAYEDGRAVGMNTFMQPSFLSLMTVPAKTVYLYQGIVTQRCARRRASGRRCCRGRRHGRASRGMSTSGCISRRRTCRARRSGNRAGSSRSSSVCDVTSTSASHGLSEVDPQMTQWAQIRFVVSGRRHT